MSVRRTYRVNAPDAAIANERAKAMARGEGWTLRTPASVKLVTLTSGGDAYYDVTLVLRDRPELS